MHLPEGRGSGLGALGESPDHPGAWNGCRGCQVFVTVILWLLIFVLIVVVVVVIDEPSNTPVPDMAAV